MSSTEGRLPGEVWQQGGSWRGSDPRELEVVVEAAFDYRGDVTLTLADESQLRGYLANRRLEGEERWIEMLPADGSPTRRLPAEAIRGIEFSGKDTASGKSWETWVTKYREKKAARARGEDVGTIGIFPEED